MTNDYKLKYFGLEGFQIVTHEEFIHPMGNMLKLERLLILDAYDSAKEWNREEKGYIGWKGDT